MPLAHDKAFVQWCSALKVCAFVQTLSLGHRQSGVAVQEDEGIASGKHAEMASEGAAAQKDTSALDLAKKLKSSTKAGRAASKASKHESAPGQSHVSTSAYLDAGAQSAVAAERLRSGGEKVGAKDVQQAAETKKKKRRQSEG
jgi:hypothetical protein